MRTQSVSPINFTAGEVKFVNRHFVSKPMDRIADYIPERLGETLEEAKKILQGTPYDVYVARNRENMNMFEFFGAMGSNKADKPVLIPENQLVERFADGIRGAIEQLKSNGVG